MKAIADPDHALERGLALIRTEFGIEPAFPDAVLSAAADAARRTPTAHVDRTDRPFVTLDPAGSTDLDQAFWIEAAGCDLMLHYAIADIGWFVDHDGAIDREAWRRGITQYLPDGKAGLYPPVLSEGAASLLPDGPRPAVVFTVAVDPGGAVRLDGAERAIIRSRAKLAYESVTAADLPDDFAELSARMARDEDRRGAARVDPPEQEVDAVPGGGFQLIFRPRLASEANNAAMSLAANMAIADLLLANGTGLFRVMDEPDAKAVRRLRQTAAAFGMRWPAMASLTQFERTLDPAVPKHAAFMLAVRRAGSGASYVPYHAGVVPWHAAMAATYAHATAPMRRLADRYVVDAALAIANGAPVPERATAAFEALPEVMARSAAIGGRIDRAVIDLAEAAMLNGREGQAFAAVVTESDDDAAKIQLCDLPITARVKTHGAEPGETLSVRLIAVDMDRRAMTFERVR